jgi:hypothetical protein
MIPVATWQALYQAALLELSPENLRVRIDEAEKAIQQRILELRADDSGSREEARSLDDALRGLRVLAVTEFKSVRAAGPCVAQSETTS